MTRRSGRRPSRVYAIADAGRIPAERLPHACEEIAAAGVGTIQLRAKRLADETLWEVAREAGRRLEGWAGTLWIDDRVDLARMLRFDGVHLGQGDLDPADARGQLPADTLIGLSTHDGDQIDAAERDACVDWIALGPIFPTASKANPDPVVGLEGLRRLRSRTRRPLIAIGGIDADNLGAVLAAGADAAAVLSAICEGDVAANCRRLVAAAGGAA